MGKGCVMTYKVVRKDVIVHCLMEFSASEQKITVRLSIKQFQIFI